MQIKPIKPIKQPLNAKVRVPGSKSLTNRAILISALADGKTRLQNALFSDDSYYFSNALQTLGFNISMDEKICEIVVTGLGGHIPAHAAELFIGNAGTAARFLSAFLTIGEGDFYLDGDARMRERPIGDLVTALKQLGAKITAVNNQGASVCPPIKIIAAGLPGGKAKITGNVSSQYLSAVLMIAPFAQSPVEIEVSTELNSKPYVDMTLAIMKKFGINVIRDGYKRFNITPGSYSPVSDFQVESDASAASYFFAAPALCGGRVQVENISRSSWQGDIAFLDVLAKMGCVVNENGNSIEVIAVNELRGVDINMRDISDTALTLGVIAPFASTPTRIRGISSSRVKETDRVSAICNQLSRLGVHVEEHEDGMTIYPCDKIQPTTIKTYNDHRMAMAFSLIGLRVPRISIENPSCVAKTFPSYFNELESLQ